MRQTSLLALILVTGLGGCSRAVDPHSRALEEYAVYSAVISGMFSGKGVELIVVQVETVTGIHDDTWPDPAQRLTGRAPLGEPLEKPKSETVRDFLAKNKQAARLEARFNLKLRYVLLSTNDIDTYFRHGGGGWDAFHARFPASQGIISFSRVGFSSDMEQALVYVQNQLHSLAGAGYYVLLGKEGGRWVIQDAERLWVS